MLAVALDKAQRATTATKHYSSKNTGLKERQATSHKDVLVIECALVLFVWC